MKKEFETAMNTPFTNPDYSLQESNPAPVVMMENTNFVADLTSRQTTFCSMAPETVQEKAVLFKAMNNPEKRIADCINMTIMAKDIYCETVTCTNQQTGEQQVCPRIVIIDENGVGYQAVSLGIFSGIKKVIQVFGMPTWGEPLPLIVKQVTKGERKLLTFDVQI